MSNATLGGGPPLPAHKISGHFVEFISVSAVFTFLSTVCVALRFASRMTAHSVWWDDWISLGALTFSYGYFISVVVAGTTGRSGFHIADYTARQLETSLKILLAVESMYNFSIALSKISLLIFYRRIFNVKSFRIAVWITIGIVVSYWLTNGLGLVLAYSPVRAQWEPWLPHTSINTKAFWMSMGIINVILDFGILCMPQVPVWRLHLSAKRRFLLSLLFLVGFFTCIASIVRLIYLNRVSTADPTYTLTPPGIWTMIEMNMSIMCGCAPSFPHLFRHWYDGGVLSIFGLSFSGGSSKSAWLNSFRRKKMAGSVPSSSSGGSIEKMNSPPLSALREGYTGPTSNEATTTGDNNNSNNNERAVHVRTEFQVVRVDRPDHGQIDNPPGRSYGW